MNNPKTLPKKIEDEIVEVLETRAIRVGTFAVFDTPQIKGLRVNLEKIRTYAKNGEDSVQISYDSGTGTILKFATEKDALEALERLDSYCL